MDEQTVTAISEPVFMSDSRNKEATLTVDPVHGISDEGLMLLDRIAGNYEGKMYMFGKQIGTFPMCFYEGDMFLPTEEDLEEYRLECEKVLLDNLFTDYDTYATAPRDARDSFFGGARDRADIARAAMMYLAVMCHYERHRAEAVE